MQAVSIRSAQMIYRGWGILTLITPIAAILLLAYFSRTQAPRANTHLAVLLGASIGAAVNVLLGLWLNRAPRQKGRSGAPSFLFRADAVAALVIVAVCVVVALVALRRDSNEPTKVGG